MKVTIKMIFDTPAGRMMTSAIPNVRQDYDVVEVAKEAVRRKKMEYGVELELESVFVDGVDMTEEIK